MAPAPTFLARPIPAVELRIKFDVQGTEQNRPRHILYNFRGVPLNEEVAHSTIQIAHWVISQNGMEVPIRSVEYVDLLTGNVYTVARQSQRMLRVMEEAARIIATLWPSI